MESVLQKEIEAKLPPIEKEIFKDEMSAYGFSHIISKKLGYNKTPFSYGGWMHGWMFLPLMHPQQLLPVSFDPKAPYVVATQKQCDYLRSKGYKNIIAGGLPFLYSDDEDDENISVSPNSLVVMPGHSTQYGLDGVPWQRQKYIDHIVKYKDHFTDIIFCLNQNCIKHGYWINELNAANIPYIAGAESYDINSFKRLKTIFRHFEYMTTDQIGSHVLYASWCGLKVSISSEFIHNPTCKLEKSYRKMDDFYEKNLNQHNIEKLYPQLCVEPLEAKINKEWATEELGKDCMIPIENIPEIFGWNNKMVQFYGIFSGGLMRCRQKQIFRRIFYHIMKKIIYPLMISKNIVSNFKHEE